MKTALVCGAGGFIGHHLVGALKKKGYFVRGVDLKFPEFESTKADEFWKLDLREKRACQKVTEGMREVYQLAAVMGGIGFIETVKARVIHDNVLINTHMLESSRINQVKRYFFPSSACIYPKAKQKRAKANSLIESSAYPAQCDTEYGWEKLLTERLCQNYYSDYGLETRVARFHNVYGPLGVYQGGKEKSPAAICRKIALAKKEDVIEVWGDGKQVRSYLYIDDCLTGIEKLMNSNLHQPVNIGSDQAVSINELVAIVAKIANKRIKIKHDLSKPQGVRGRNSDNSLAYQELNWKPNVSLEQGLAKTYQWINKRLHS